MSDPKKLTKTQVFIGSKIVPIIQKAGSIVGIDIEQINRKKSVKKNMEKQKEEFAKQKAEQKAEQKMLQRIKEKKEFENSLESIRLKREKELDDLLDNLKKVVSGSTSSTNLKQRSKTASKASLLENSKKPVKNQSRRGSKF